MEIEIRAFVDDLERVEERLNELGAKFKSEIHIIDWWFCSKENKSFEEIQQHEPDSYSLRIRKYIDDDKNETTELNCKVIKTLGDHSIFDEYETRVDNLKQLNSILESIGFKVFCVVDKERKIYELDNCSINLENIKGFRPAIELEIVDDKDAEKHKEYLENLLALLGIKEKDKIDKSITHLYMKENAFKEYS